MQDRMYTRAELFELYGQVNWQDPCTESRAAGWRRNLAAAEAAFGIRMDGRDLAGDERALWLLFTVTLRCHASPATPGTAAAESSLVDMAVERCVHRGLILSHLAEVESRGERLRHALLGLADALFVAVHPEAPEQVSMAALVSHGFGPVEW